MTVAVQQLEVGFPIGPAAALGDDVIHFHPIALREEQAALWTLSVLSLEESGNSGRDLRMLPQAGTPIHPIPIIRGTHTVNLHVSLNRRLPVAV